MPPGKDNWERSWSDYEVFDDLTLSYIAEDAPSLHEETWSGHPDMETPRSQEEVL